MKYIKLYVEPNRCTGCVFDEDENDVRCKKHAGIDANGGALCNEKRFILIEDTPENRVRVVTERLKS